MKITIACPLRIAVLGVYRRLAHGPPVLWHVVGAYDHCEHVRALVSPVGPENPTSLPEATRVDVS